jgi:hypothetical protein
VPDVNDIALAVFRMLEFGHHGPATIMQLCGNRIQRYLFARAEYVPPEVEKRSICKSLDQITEVSVAEPSPRQVTDHDAH